MSFNNKRINQYLFDQGLKAICVLFVCALFFANSVAALEVNFSEHGTRKDLDRDAQELFRLILPEADVLDLRIESINLKQTAVMTVLLDKEKEDGFMILKEIPEINSYTYLVAWMLQGHYSFLRKEGKSLRQKRHLKVLSRYFDGRTISGNDTFYAGETVELFYEPMVPKIQGMNFLVSPSNRVVYSGSTEKTGFAQILVPGFKPKYIAILPNNNAVLLSQREIKQ